MALTKITAAIIEDGAITASSIANTSITADKLHTTLDLTGKAVTVATATAGDNDTTVASTAFVSTAIANLADSAPSTLDTLNELAAALGDDANFSTTVTNSIATKAPLASPDFTGDATFDTSTLVVDATNDRVGIGIAPLTTFHVNVGANKNFVLQDALSSTALKILDNGGTAYTAGTINASTFSINGDSGGNVGIGTSSPDSDTSLHVVSSGATASTHIQAGTVAAFERSQSTAGAYLAVIGANNGISALHLGDSDDDDVGNIAYNHSSNFMTFATAGTERMRITSDGNVFLQTGGAALQWQNGYQTITGAADSNDLTYRTYQNHIWKTGTGASSTTDGTERMRIASNGDVHLRGGNQMTNALAWYNSLGPYELASIENVSHSSYNDSGGLLFKTAGLSNSGMSERMRLNSSGQCLINFSNPASTSNFLLGVDGSIGLGGDDFIASGAGYGPSNSSAGAGTIKLYDTGTGNMQFNQTYSHARYYFYHGGNEVFRIEDGGFSGIYGYSFYYTTQYGSVGLGALNNGYHHTMAASGPSTFYWNNRCEASGGFHTYSDERFKENITTIPGALDKVALMNGVTFNWIDAENRGSGDTGKQFGVIAQNMLTVDPELPSLNPDPLATQEEIDNEELETDYYTMDYSRITPFLIEAIKELKTKLEAAEARITTLEG